MIPWILTGLLAGSAAWAGYKKLTQGKKHPGTAPGKPPVQTPPAPTANGGTSFTINVPGGQNASFVTQPVAAGVIAIPTTNLTTGTSFDAITLAPGHIGDVLGATVGTTDFLLQVPTGADGIAKGGIGSVYSSNPKVIPTVAPIPEAGQAAALDIGAPLAAGYTQIQVTWTDGAGVAQTTTFSISAG